MDDIYWDNGLILDAGDAPAASRRTVLSSAPNSFADGTELRFELPRATPYAIAVLDAAGRRVRESRGIGRAGANVVRWDGRDAAGTPTRPGVYHYRLEAKGATTARRVVRVE